MQDVSDGHATSGKRSSQRLIKAPSNSATTTKFLKTVLHLLKVQIGKLFLSWLAIAMKDNLMLNNKLNTFMKNQFECLNVNGMTHFDLAVHNKRLVKIHVRLLRRYFRNAEKLHFFDVLHS